MADKLTSAQMRTLMEIYVSGAGGKVMADYYPPIRALLARGLICEQKGRYCDVYVATAAGVDLVEGGANAR